MQKLRVGLITVPAFLGIVVCFLGFVGASAALPLDRHYEMVSPPFKGGFGVQELNAVSPNGESIAFRSPGVFNEDPGFAYRPELPNYLASRGSSNWATLSMETPATLSWGAEEDLSPTLGLEFSLGPPNVNRFEPFDRLDAWTRPASLPDTLANWQQVSLLNVESHELGFFGYEGSSVDFCHIFLAKQATSKAVNIVEPVAEAEDMARKVYEVDLGCHGEPVGVKLVGVNNAGKLISGPNCLVDIGNQYYGHGISTYNAVSTNGSAVFFTDCPVEPESPADFNVKHQLFVRLGETRTLEISRPLEAAPFGGCVGESKGPVGEVPCEGAAGRASAEFQGASEDGSRVYFTAPLEKGQTPLVSGDTDESNNLYVAEIDCPSSNSGCAAAEREVTSMKEASYDPNGGMAEVQGLLRVAPKGQRVYFVASGDLLTTAQQQVIEKEDRPVPEVGAANLYAYDSVTDATSFIADLCTGAERSGATEDYRCPSNESDEKLWSHGPVESGESQVGGSESEYLVFSTYAQLTSEDTNSAKDVYRYDALTGALTLISHGENGYEPNGFRGGHGSRVAQGRLNGHVFEQHQLGRRAISEDGSRIVFTSAEPLSPADTNGLVNAYEWNEGAVSLVSAGSDPEGVENVIISADGSSVVFTTADRLLPQDNDELVDIYAARLGAEFPPVPAQRKPCEGDGCQGPLTTPAQLLMPGSVSQEPGENQPPPVVAAARKTKAKSRSRCRRPHGKNHQCTARKRKGRKAVAARHSINSSNRGGRS